MRMMFDYLTHAKKLNWLPFWGYFVLFSCKLYNTLSDIGAWGGVVIKALPY